eukprot:7210482-Pyramimonas_sp.AAC.2
MVDASGIFPAMRSLELTVSARCRCCPGILLSACGRDGGKPSQAANGVTEAGNTLRPGPMA